MLDPVSALLQLRSENFTANSVAFTEMTNVDLSMLRRRANGIKRCFDSHFSSSSVGKEVSGHHLPHKKRRVVSTVPGFRTITSATKPSPIVSQGKVVSPKDVMIEILTDAGFTPKFKTARYLQDEGGYFLEMGESNIAAYNNDTIMAVREQNSAKLQEVHDLNPSFGLQCCNQFGESVMHMSCRRGYPKVATFLIKKANVNARVTDDYGRTPLHDACWTTEPNEELMKLLLTEVPDLLLVKDARGHTPLDYVSRGYWSHWLKFLQENKSLLVANEMMKKHFSSE
jgi:hypothetical protein